jgi:3-dehydro-L-gulonate 2-dehydrogenase
MASDTKQAPEVLRIPFARMESEFHRVLHKVGFEPAKAERCARLFAENSLDGIYSHGINRFPRFIQYINEGYVDVHAEPELVHRAGAVEQWDGRLGPGPLNALFCTEKAMELSRETGIGCVALSNTNHWMRGGHYGWKAAEAGFAFVGWTNTTSNMPAWGALDCRLGNNPLVLAVPYEGGVIVLDMAMSQFSYGKVEEHQLLTKDLPAPGGYDANGRLTNHPSEILESRRLLPMGYWKGSGLALLLDVLSVILSGGSSTVQITKRKAEYGVSQVFVAFDLSQLNNRERIPAAVREVIEDLHGSAPVPEMREVLYPGERVLRTRAENLRLGIPVVKSVWEEVRSL